MSDPLIQRLTPAATPGLAGRVGMVLAGTVPLTIAAANTHAAWRRLPGAGSKGYDRR